MLTQEDFAARFAGVDRVVAVPERFKLRLGIGENAYASLRIKKTLREFWDVGGMAATGAGVAASPTVASTFFASTATGGVMGWLGLGAAAATPVGWVVAAAVASGGAYWGVTRMMGSFSGSRVQVIPKFLNTPMDLLAASLFDLIGALAARISAIDGQIDETERAVIVEHFVADWGMDRAYVTRALAMLYEMVERTPVKDLARALASFQMDNPDCNPTAMQTELMQFLRSVAEADGRLDEREELALDAIERVLREERDIGFKKAGNSIVGWAKGATSSMGDLATKLPTLPWRDETKAKISHNGD
jgi:tellurite resistance protein